MTSGIYALYWWEQDLVYVGQTQNLHRRWGEHRRDLQGNKHTNYKVQQSYNLHGMPDLIVLEFTDLNTLNCREVFWQNELNSLNSLDIVKAGQVGFGPEANSSKYTRREVLKVFACLYSNKYNNFKEIADRCNLLKTYLVADIYKGAAHLWLKIKYPAQYSRMRSIDYVSKSRRSKDAVSVCTNLVCNNRSKFTLSGNITDAAIELKNKYYPEDTIEVIRKGVSRVLNHTRKSWRGWKLED